MKQPKQVIAYVTLCLLSGALLCSCSEEPRRYEEIVSAPEPAATSLRWELPPGWTAGSGDPMRLATFTEGSGADAVECSLVVLPGGAGGLQANIRRWLGQIGLPAVPDAEIDRFITSQKNFFSDGGLPVQLVDLTAFPGQAPGAKSMLAAVVSTLEGSIFVKMAGPKNRLEENRGRFLSFCKSLSQKDPYQ